jgi:hypothetical protein
MLAQKSIKKRVNIILDEETQQYLALAAKERNISASELVREMIYEMKQREGQKILREAAASLYDVYATDKELTAFTSLDGEDFQ